MNANAGALGLCRGVREGGLLPHHLLHHHQDVAHLHQAVQHLEQLLSCFCSINDIHPFEILLKWESPGPQSKLGWLELTKSSGIICVPIVIVMAMMIGLEFIRRGLSRISDDYGDDDDGGDGDDGDDDWR